ncbi:hypothetical protein N9K98_01580 [Luminiphilus sp.]|nr:hypothetical protein [Luminiphilus sp.]
MAFQDDARENHLIELFDLEQPAGRTRSDIDAFLSINEHRLPFELKTTSTGSVTTVRDFGPDHIAKWRDEHWLIGVYDKKGQNMEYALYGSPQRMRPWIEEKEEYIRRDFELANLAPRLFTESHLDQIMGHKATYSLQDAKLLHKKQYSMEEYLGLADLPKGNFTRQRMLQIVQDRLQYIASRGSTLNNPHIPASYFKGWQRITENHSAVLRSMVLRELI